MTFTLTHLRLLADVGHDPSGQQCADNLTDPERRALRELEDARLVTIASRLDNNATPITRTMYWLSDAGRAKLQKALEAMK